MPPSYHILNLMHPHVSQQLPLTLLLVLFSNNTSMACTWHPISFFSRKMTPTETRYSTFDRENLAVYLMTIKHFRHFLEGRLFHVLTVHKPLTFALHTRSDRYSPCQARQLDYISQITSNIRHVATGYGKCSCRRPFSHQD